MSFNEYVGNLADLLVSGAKITTIVVLVFMIVRFLVLWFLPGEKGR